MQQEQRAGEALLAVERLEGVVDNAAVHEVEVERQGGIAVGQAQGVKQGPKEVVPDNVLIRPPLGIVALDDGDLDPAVSFDQLAKGGSHLQRPIAPCPRKNRVRVPLIALR